MQGNQSIQILEISFPLYSDLGSNAKLCQPEREENVMFAQLVVNGDILRIKTYQKIPDNFMDLLSEIRGPDSFGPHKQPWLWGVLLEEAFPVADSMLYLLSALTQQRGTWAARRVQRIAKCDKSWKQC